MNLERAEERAHSVRGRESAARLYNEIEYELALGEPDDRLESAGEQALAVLENRFSGVREAAREIVEPPNLSRRANDALHGIRRRTPLLRPPVRRGKHYRQAQPQPARNPLYADAHLHPLPALAIVALLIIVIVHVWAYIVLGVIALAALKAGRR